MSAFMKSGLDSSRSRRGVSCGPTSTVRTGAGVAMPPSVTVTVSGPGATPARTSIASSWPRSSTTSQTRVVPSAER